MSLEHGPRKPEKGLGTKKEIKEDETTIRQVEKDDLEDFLDLEKHIWGEPGEGPEQRERHLTIPLTEEHFNAWLRTHPEGFLGSFKVMEQEGELKEKMVAYAYAQISYFSPPTEADRKKRGYEFIEQNLPHWSTITRQGFSEGAHNPDENCLYGVSISSHPEAAGEGWRLVLRMRQLALEKDKQYMAAAFRISGIGNWLRDKYKIIEDSDMKLNGGDVKGRLARLGIDLYKEANNYARLVINDKVKDPTMSVFYKLTQLFKKRAERKGVEEEFKFEGIVPDYFYDPESCNMAALFYWTNPEYKSKE